MTLQFIDGFDHYTSSGDMLLKWDTVSGITISSTQVRGNGSGSSAVATSDTHYARKMGLGAHATYIIGAAYYFTQFPIDWELCTFWETTTQAQVIVRIGSTGNLTIYRGNEVTSIGTLAAAMPNLNTWYQMECKVVISATVGTVTIRINGGQVLNLSNLNTQGGATTNINGVGIGSPFPGAGTFAALYVDDFYALNGSGTTNNNFLGVMRVGTLMPSAAGNYSQFTAVGTTPNYACVNEVPEDGDATYVTSSTLNQIDSYVVPDLPSAAITIAGVQVNLVARKDDVSTRAITPLQRSGGTDALGAASGDLPQTYANIRSVYDNSIVSGSAWTVSEINDSEFGVEVTT